ncbi:hypothetical protein FRIGORI9N_70058 [Frigoribacterium sp. 9N]|nr:hypothetical protein FRIGORI9N_70058 [Frigoribacterium sp. 9N]
MARKRGLPRPTEARDADHNRAAGRSSPEGHMLEDFALIHATTLRGHPDDDALTDKM